MSIISWSVIYVLLYFAAEFRAYPTFYQKIPNGKSVPNPCDSLSTWIGVGHFNKDGGGLRNSFGKDFENQNLSWTSVLCQMDSDGDSRTNGQELGDPNCVWIYDANNPVTPQSTHNITHPGICDPYNSPACHDKNMWLQCNTKIKCSAKDSQDVRNITLRFSPTNIPVKATTYACRNFQLPQDGLYDVIAHDPVIDNRMVAHHILVYGCDSSAKLTNFTDNYECIMGPPVGCFSLIAIWSSGQSGSCHGPDYGFRIGQNLTAKQSGFKYALLQIHWNNYALSPSLYDSSGIILYYTPRLRPNQAAVLLVSQYDLFLPPRLDSIVLSGACSSDCTRKYLKNSVNVTQATVHMHLLGRRGSIAQYRDGQFLRYILQDQEYNYNSPVMYNMDVYKDLRPGDEVVTTCNFNTTRHRNITKYGISTQDEMCIAFLIYYPAQKLPFVSCGQIGHVPQCQEDQTPLCDNTNLITKATAVNISCSNRECSYDCYQAIDAFNQTGCLSDASYEYLTFNIRDLIPIYDFIDECQIMAVKSCDVMKAMELGGRIIDTCNFDCTSDCVQLVSDYKDTGCVQPSWRYMRRKYEKIAAIIMSCEQFIGQQVRTSSTSPLPTPYITNSHEACPAKTDTNVRKISLRFPRTNIPAQETNLFCQTFLLPQDDLYDVVADDPIIDNWEVAHHMSLYGCDPDVYMTNFDDVYECSTSMPQRCKNLISLWSPGISGSCHGPEYGFRIGRNSSLNKTGYKYALLQINWNNYGLKQDLYDSSGILLYYTPKLRPNEAAVLQVSQNKLFLPPRLDSVIQNATCVYSCTSKYINDKIYITRSYIQMHLLGRRGSIAQYRNRQFIGFIQEDHAYDFYTPTDFQLNSNKLDKYKEMRAGDQLVVTCNFNTTTTRDVTRYGEGTRDEMCVGFVTYYPAQTPAFTSCGQNGHATECLGKQGYACDASNLVKIATAVRENCNDNSCNASCTQSIENFRNTSCLADAPYESLYLIDPMLNSILDFIDFCQLRAVSTCNLNSSLQLRSMISELCDFSCSEQCVQLTSQFKSTGCLEVGWRYLMRNYDRIAAIVMTCEQFIVPESTTPTPVQTSAHLSPWRNSSPKLAAMPAILLVYAMLIQSLQH